MTLLVIGNLLMAILLALFLRDSRQGIVPPEHMPSVAILTVALGAFHSLVGLSVLFDAIEHDGGSFSDPSAVRLVAISFLIGAAYLILAVALFLKAYLRRKHHSETIEL